MNLANIKPGNDVPNDLNVVIEIPERSEPVKYEVDKDSGALFVDRFMATAMYYPANYGYIPQTLSDDGDPVDVLVLSAMPLISGSVIRSRPIGILKMTDESGFDAKILAVPVDKITVYYKDVQSYKDIVPHTLKTIEHFFSHYKDLEEGKWVKIEGWDGPDAARAEIVASVERYQSQN